MRHLQKRIDVIDIHLPEFQDLAGRRVQSFRIDVSDLSAKEEGVVAFEQVVESMAGYFLVRAMVADLVQIHKLIAFIFLVAVGVGSLRSELSNSVIASSRWRSLCYLLVHGIPQVPVHPD